MDRQSRVRTLRQRAASVRRTMHAMILAAIALVVGVTSLTAAAEPDPSPGAANTVVTATALQKPQTPQTPAEVSLKVGETATLDGGALSVTLLAVTEDSRCPKEVLCVWSGRAVVALHVELDGADRGDVSATLMPGGRGSDPSGLDAVVDRYTLALTDLQPYPDRSHPEPTLDTVATLRVTVTP